MQKFKTYVINLQTDKDRMLFMNKQLHDFGIEYERVEGINGKEYDFKDEYDEVLAIKLNGKPLTSSELGCAKSHQICLKAAEKNNSGYTLILEDDVLLPVNFLAIAHEMIAKNEKSHKWDYLLFDYPKPGMYFFKHWLGTLARSYKKLDRSVYKKVGFILYSFIKLCYIAPLCVFEGLRNRFFEKSYIGEAVLFYRPLYFAGAYLVTSQGAAKLLDVQQKIVYAADRLPNVARVKKGLQFFAYAPLSVFQQRDNFVSNIHPVAINKNE